VYSVDEIDAAPDAGERGEIMLQQLDLLDAAVGGVVPPAELKLDDVTPSLEPVQLMQNLAADADQPVMKLSSVKVKTGASSSLLRRLLKYSLPLPLLFVIVFGGLYLLCDGLHEALNDLGLLINPQLKYVHGAPPV